MATVCHTAGSLDDVVAGLKGQKLCQSQCMRANGVMTVIADWPHLPRQAEVQNEIHRARDGYTTDLPPKKRKVLPMCPVRSVTYVSGRSFAAP
jgi:hypothetical protein